MKHLASAHLQFSRRLLRLHAPAKEAGVLVAWHYLGGARERVRHGAVCQLQVGQAYDLAKVHTHVGSTLHRTVCPGQEIPKPGPNFLQ